MPTNILEIYSDIIIFKMLSCLSIKFKTITSLSNKDINIQFTFVYKTQILLNLVSSNSALPYI